MTALIEYVLNDIATFVGVAKGSAVIALLVVSELVLWAVRTRARRTYHEARAKVTGVSDVEAISIAYYRRRQMIGIVRAVVFLVALLLGALLYDVQTFGVLALALSALVIIQKENINSLFAYVFVLSNFRVGDDIKVGEYLGEIVRVSPLQTVLSGKEENGEYNGQRIVIPNYKLVTESVQEQELKSDTYRRIIVRAIYEHGTYDADFGEFIRRIRTFLDEFLPKRGLEQVGNFRSFAGVQYKMSFDYDEAGKIIVRIAFISRPHDVSDRKEQIIEFIEGMRMKKKRKMTAREEQKEFEKEAQ